MCYSKMYFTVAVSILYTDMFLAGSETTTKSLDYAFLCLVRQPELQIRIQKELDIVIGRERKPCLEDRQKLVKMSFLGVVKFY